MPHIQPVLAFDVISVKKEQSHMSQIPAAASGKKKKPNNRTTKTLSESRQRPGPESPFKYSCNNYLQSRVRREPLFSSQSAWLEPDPVSSSLVEDNMFLQFDSKSTFSYDLLIFSSPLSLIYNSFDLKFH